MKMLAAIPIAVLLICPPLGRAQEPGMDAPLPTQEPPSEKPTSLIPETVPKIPKSTNRARTTSEDKLAGSKTSQSDMQLKQRIRLRQVKTMALKDPVVQDDWSRASAATTDPAKRQALRDYYNHLYTRILKIDGSLTDLVKTRKEAALDRLSQSHFDTQSASETQLHPESVETPQ